jgi:hypothetical protein
LHSNLDPWQKCEYGTGERLSLITQNVQSWSWYSQ